MYIDFNKYNYQLINKDDIERYKQRDKNSYKIILKEWFDNNINSIVERKFEIDDIGFLSEISDFIKLIREAETIYELGFFTSCIALVGVSAEDFSKYISLKIGKKNHIYYTDKNRIQKDVSQFVRLTKQLKEKIITQSQYDLFDVIRLIRNDCLHFNQNFKSKSEIDLKSDAITCLNNLKKIIYNILGISNTSSIIDLLKEIAISQGIDSKTVEDVKIKLRNAISILFNLPVAFDPNIIASVSKDYFVVLDIDFDESDMTFVSLIDPRRVPVIIEIDDNINQIIEQHNIEIGDVVFSVIFSLINNITGMTEKWHIIELVKNDSLKKMFTHDVQSILAEFGR